MKISRIFGTSAMIVLLASPSVARAQYASGPYASTYVKYPRVDIGFLSFCQAIFPGPGEPMHTGYCPSVRLRLSRRWGIAMDPAYAKGEHDVYGYGMFGFRPGVQFSIVQGRGQSASSTFYAIGGMDLWIPTTSLDKTPSVFLGGHAGLGIYAATGRIGLGSELRALVRGGLGNQDDAIARDMSAVRFGFEARVMTIHASFW